MPIYQKRQGIHSELKVENKMYEITNDEWSYLKNNKYTNGNGFRIKTRMVKSKYQDRLYVKVYKDDNLYMEHKVMIVDYIYQEAIR